MVGPLPGHRTAYIEAITILFIASWGFKNKETGNDRERVKA
jgi:hypothetical protein